MLTMPKKTNCLIEFFPDEALETAQMLDDYFKKHKRPIGPLHGLPVSIKVGPDMPPLLGGFLFFLGKLNLYVGFIRLERPSSYSGLDHVEWNQIRI